MKQVNKEECALSVQEKFLGPVESSTESTEKRWLK